MFVNRSRTLAKILVWDGTGLCVYSKRLEQGRFACLWRTPQAGRLKLTIESEEISVVQRRFVVVKRRRLKYRCRCNGAVVTAPAAPRLIPGGRYSSMFAVDVAISKYLDHAPLERQRRIMARQGLNVSTQTLWDQIEALGRVLEPSYEALRERVFSAPVVYADESHW